MKNNKSKYSNWLDRKIFRNISNVLDKLIGYTIRNSANNSLRTYQTLWSLFLLTYTRAGTSLPSRDASGFKDRRRRCYGDGNQSDHVNKSFGVQYRISDARSPRWCWRWVETAFELEWDGRRRRRLRQYFRVARVPRDSSNSRFRGNSASARLRQSRRCRYGCHLYFTISASKTKTKTKQFDKPRPNT